jgi:Mn2+/Fe2+ NRAMP family transporter
MNCILDHKYADGNTPIRSGEAEQLIPRISTIGELNDRAFYWSAVVNGVVAVPRMFLLMSMATNKLVVGEFVLPAYFRIVGWIATIVMLAACVGFFCFSVRGKQ